MMNVGCLLCLFVFSAFSVYCAYFVYSAYSPYNGCSAYSAYFYYSVLDIPNFHVKKLRMFKPQSTHSYVFCSTARRLEPSR